MFGVLPCDLVGEVLAELAREGHVQLVIAVEVARLDPADAVPLEDAHDGLSLATVTDGGPPTAVVVLQVGQRVDHDL